jgi:3',5'-cyclic AMP phosphodiesterase CpdA
MIKIFHASDLHFGKTNPLVVGELRKAIDLAEPDLVVLSGDFTQIGSRQEFRLANDLIRDIKQPVFTVPGNHDIPRVSLWERFITPFARYKKYINEELNPVLETDDLVMAGINTARPIVPHWNWAHGMVSKKQIEFIRKTFTEAPKSKCKAMVCHHPLYKIQDAPIDTIVWRGRELVRVLTDLNVDLVLTGHIHQASVTLSGTEKQLAYIGAASAASTRLRTHGNGFNMIEIGKDTIAIDLMEWSEDKFTTVQSHTLKRNMQKDENSSS